MLPKAKTVYFHVDVNSAFLSWTAIQHLANGETLDLRTVPAVALFRDSVYLGAVQGLKDWNEYCRQLSEIVVREKAPVRRVAFMQEKTVSHCSD